MSAEATPKAKKHVQECVEAGRCLCCENKSLKRGLCYQCYYKWRTAWKSLGSATRRAEFDSKLIRRGQLLAQQEVRSWKKKNAFSTAASEVSR